MTARPSLLIVSFSPIASDARVLKQVKRFAADLDVTTCGYGPAPEGVVEHLEIPAEAVAWRKDPKWLLTRQYRRVYRGSAAVRAAQGLLGGREFDVVLANDVDTVPLALSLRPRHGVHADLHEYSPRQNTELRRWRWFVAPYMRWLCRRFVTRAASVTTVGQGIAREYERRFGFRPQVVTNAAPYAELEPGPTADGGPVRGGMPVIKDDGPTAEGGPLRLVHAGVALRGRNLTALVDAVAATSTDVTLDLFLVPNDPGYLAELRARAESEPRVRLREPVPYSGLVPTLHGFDVGVHVLPPVSFNNAWALPNKFFDFVQARLGVIVGPSPEMARLVEEHGLGAVAADFSAEALTAVLDSLTPERVRTWKRASHAAARALSSDSQVEVWRQAITTLLDQPQLRRGREDSPKK